MKRIAILGSTGSIGTSTLKVARHLRNEIEIAAIAAHSNIDLLEQQAREFNPKLIGVYVPEKAVELQKRLPRIEIVSGMEGLQAVASSSEIDYVVSAISGTLGLPPTLAAIEAGKDVGLANKEALVSGGAIVMSLVKEKKVKLLPIDSEHSAIFQCLNGENPAAIQRLILTASGGPFRQYSHEQLKSVTPELALKHPTWSMGPKVTIDSSTLLNKGLEMIEAYWLFGISASNIEVVVHPQSLIHSLVEFVDGSMLAQMCQTDMVLPIQYALTYPKRHQGLLKPFDFMSNQTLQFFKPDLDKFVCLKLAYHAIKEGGSLPCYMNAANEVLVHRFLKKEISWLEIGTKLETLMQKHKIQPIPNLEAILEIEKQGKREAID